MPDSSRYRVVRTPGRYAVLLNARARGWTGTVHHAVQRHVSTRDLFLTDDFHQARRTVGRLLQEDYDAIFVGGGDGTVVYLINEMEQAIRGGQIAREDAPPIGVLRLGTGNAIANYLGADDILRDLRALRAGAPLTIHEVNMLEGAEGLFPFAGLGWDADILNDYDMLKDAVRDTALESYVTGLSGYGLAITSRTLPRALTQKPMRVRIVNEAEGARQIDYEGNTLREFAPGELMYEGPARICGASSIPYWGFQVRMFPHADSDPDRFQVRCYFGPVREVVMHLRNFWRGKVREEWMFDALVRRARLELEGAAAPYQVSGDAAGVERVIEWNLAPHPAHLAVPLH